MHSKAGLLIAGNANYVCNSCRNRLATLSVARRTPSRRLHQSTKARLDEAETLWKAKAEEELAGAKPSMLKILEDRGYVNQIAGDRSKTEDVMRRERIGAYVGIDPTAPSMHVGHLVPFMALFWMYVHGYHTYTLLGGATAQVGDPTGRTTSRDLDNPSRKENIVRMHLQLKTVWANLHHHLTQRLGYKLDVGSKRGLLNNNVWLHKLSITEFLRIMGNHTRVGTMLGRETARYKMEHGDGLSFSEFTYPLLQGWDWFHMYRTLNVKMQIGGSDQMGNIAAGREAFMAAARVDQFERKLKDLSGATPVGFTVPLLTTAAGAKFGKSAGNAVWIDPEMTSVFDQFQFFVRTQDADLERYLKLFTFLPLERIAQVMEENQKDPSKRFAGKVLAEEVCLVLHGEYLTNKAKDEHAAIFGRKGVNVNVNTAGTESKFEPTGTGVKDQLMNPILNPRAAQANAQSEFSRVITLPASKVMSSSYPALLKYTGLVSSRSEGNRLIRSGGAYVGASPAGQVMSDEYTFSKIMQGQDIKTVNKYSLDAGSMLVLRVGKWKTKIIKMISDQEWAEGVKKGQAEITKAEAYRDSGETPPEQSNTTLMNWARLNAEIQAEEARFAEAEAAKRERNNNIKELKKSMKAELRL